MQSKIDIKIEVIIISEVNEDKSGVGLLYDRPESLFTAATSTHTIHNVKRCVPGLSFFGFNQALKFSLSIQIDFGGDWMAKSGINLTFIKNRAALRKWQKFVMM